MPHLAVFEAPRVTSTSARTTLLMTFHIPHHAAATLISTSEKLLGTFWVLRRVEKRNERSRVEGCRLTTALGIRRLSAYLGGLHKLIGCSNRQRVNALWPASFISTTSCVPPPKLETLRRSWCQEATGAALLVGAHAHRRLSLSVNNRPSAPTGVLPAKYTNRRVAGDEVERRHRRYLWDRC